jgi:hypothetical protein
VTAPADFMFSALRRAAIAVARGDYRQCGIRLGLSTTCNAPVVAL